MSAIISALSPHKRKREPHDDMADDTPRKRSIRETLLGWTSPGFLRLFKDRSSSSSDTRVASTTRHNSPKKPSQKTLDRQPHEYEIPGSFPDATGPPPESKHHSRNARAEPQHRSATSVQRAAGDRNKATYWETVGREISKKESVASQLDPSLHNIPRPPPYAKFRRKIPLKSRPLHQGVKSSGTSQPLVSTHEPSITKILENARSSLRTSTDGAAVRDAEVPDEAREQLRKFFIDNEGEEGLGDVPANLKRSEKLANKDRSKKGMSPGLEAALLERLTLYNREKAEEEARKLRPQTPEKPRQLVVPLAADVLNSLPNLAKLDGSQQLGMFGRIPVTARDLLTLRNGVWLNDEVINSWLWELCDKAKVILAKEMEARGTPIKDDTPRYHAFNTQWYPTMKAADWRNKVPRWAKRAKIDGANLLKVHKVLIPIHHGAHWTLLVILPQRRTVRYFDSLAGNAKPYLQAATDWVSHELGDKWNESEWRVEQADSGQQVNMSDCGVFLSLNALATFYTDVLPEVLPTGELSTGRDLMKYILLNGGFKDDYELAKLHPSFRLEEDRQVNGEVRKTNKDNVKAG